MKSKLIGFALVLSTVSCLFVSRGLEVAEAYVVLAPDTNELVSRDSLSMAKDILQARLDESSTIDDGVRVAVDGENLRVDLVNPSDLNAVSKLCLGQGILEFVDSIEPLSEGMENPSGARVILSDLDIDSVSLAEDNLGNYMIALRFTSEGKEKMAEYSKHNVGHYLVIAMDGIVISSPIVNAAILDGEAVIQGQFTLAEANELATQIKSGRLPFPLRVVASGEY